MYFKHFFSILSLSLFLACTNIVLAQEQEHIHAEIPDSVVARENKSFVDKALGIFEFKIGRTSMNFYPIIAYAPSSGFQFGIMPLVVFPKKEGMYGTDEHVSATLALYLDVLNLFIALLSILGIMRND